MTEVAYLAAAPPARLPDGRPVRERLPGVLVQRPAEKIDKERAVAAMWDVLCVPRRVQGKGRVEVARRPTEPRNKKRTLKETIRTLPPLLHPSGPPLTGESQFLDNGFVHFDLQRWKESLPRFLLRLLPGTPALTNLLTLAPSTAACTARNPDLPWLLSQEGA